MKKLATHKFNTHIHFCVTWKYVPNLNMVSISLRNPDIDINLGQIAMNIKNGTGRGGGHVEAAGFSFQGIENFHKFILREKPNVLQESLTLVETKYGC